MREPFEARFENKKATIFTFRKVAIMAQEYTLNKNWL